MHVRIKILLLVLAAVTAVHVTQIRTGYAYDDIEAILENDDLRDWSKAGDLLKTNYWGSRNIGLYRPLVQLSFLIDGAGFGFDPAVSHGIQLILHLAVVGLLFLLLTRIGLSDGMSGVSAVLYGLSPAILGGSVWISGRTDVLSALFVLAGLHASISASQRDEGFAGRWTVTAAVCYLLGLMSKEMAVTLPLFVLLLPGGPAWRRIPALTVAFAIYLVMRHNAVTGFLPSFIEDGVGVVFKDRDIFERVVMGCRACLRLLALTIVPVGLAADHRAHEWAHPEANPGSGVVFFIGWVAMLWYARRLRRDGNETMAFLLGACALSLLPILQIIPIGAVMAERFNYTPALFLLPFAVWLGGRGCERWAPRLAAPLLLIALVGSGVITAVRIPVYTDRGTYCRDVVRAYPHDEKAWNNLGVYLYLPDERLEGHKPDYAAADRAFAKAIEVYSGKDTYKKARLNRARALLERQRVEGDTVDLSPIDTWLAGGEKERNPDALYLLGKADLRTGRAARSDERRRKWFRSSYERLSLAARRFEEKGRSRLRQAAAWKEAGLAAQEMGDHQGMITAWTEALKRNPNIQGAAVMRRRLAAIDPSRR